MRFEEREIKPYAEPITQSDLRIGHAYFSVTYADDDMLIPIVETVVFIGRNLESGESGQVYFQDINSYRRGVRYEAAGDESYAQFSTGSENEVGHLFEYEHALEELMRCSVRRREGNHFEDFNTGDGHSKSSAEERTEKPTVQSLRFDDVNLQAHFIAELRKTDLSFEVGEDGAVLCAGEDWSAVNNIARIIRDSCYPWYLLSWKIGTDAPYQFWQEMKRLGLPFQVEHHQGFTVFLLPKAGKELHRDVIGRVSEAALPPLSNSSGEPLP